MKVSKEQLSIAHANGISTKTVYNRIDKGWSTEEAIAVPTDHKRDSKRQRSKFYGMERGKKRITAMPIAYEEILNHAIAQSGLTEMDFIAEVLAEYLEKKNPPA